MSTKPFGYRVINSFDLKDTLQPDFWQDMHLNERVRKHLLKIADDFIACLESNSQKNVYDVVLTGSIANYNWSSYSDVDVHVIVDFAKLNADPEALMDYYNSKKAIWNEEHNKLSIFGFPVELYVENINDFSGSSGVYSLIKDSWIREPKGFHYKADKKSISYLTSKYIRIIKTLEKKSLNTSDPDELQKIASDLHKVFVKLRNGRKEGLATPEKEMSVQNLLWKSLKRLGYISKIWLISGEIYDKINCIQ